MWKIQLCGHVEKAMFHVSYRRPMPKWQDDVFVELIIVRASYYFLYNYRVNYYYYIVRWCSGVACNWCVSLDVALV